MIKYVTRIAPWAVAIVFAVASGAASAWAQDSVPLYFRNGQVCWEGLPCSELATEKEAVQAKPKSISQAPKATKQRAEKPAPANAKAGSHPGVVAVKKAPSQATAAAAFYRYPMMYRGEAPPPMPPLSSVQQPYIQTSPGVWYWPAADDVRLPKIPGFEPLIEPARVIQW